VLGSTFDDQKVTVLYTCDKLHQFTTGFLVDGFCQLFVEVLNEDFGIFCLQIATVMRDNLTVFQCDDVTAYGKVIVSHFVSYGSSLQRTSTFIYLV